MYYILFSTIRNFTLKCLKYLFDITLQLFVRCNMTSTRALSVVAKSNNTKNRSTNATSRHTHSHSHTINTKSCDTGFSNCCIIYYFNRIKLCNLLLCVWCALYSDSFFRTFCCIEAIQN